MATPGMRPLTEAELAQGNPGALLASAYHVNGVLKWMTRVSRRPRSCFRFPCGAASFGWPASRSAITSRALSSAGFETRRVSIGSGSFVNVGCWFEGAGRVDIGRDVFLGSQVMILTSVHEIDTDGQVARMPVGVYVGVPARRVR